MIRCGICGFKGKNLYYHIIREHELSIEDYKNKFESNVVSLEVVSLRKDTTRKRHGDPNYRNREAQKLMFSDYEGGHPFKDPKCRKKGSKTKERLYGDPNYTNREKAKKTNLERYGVEHTSAAPEVVQKRVRTLKERYGKVFNVEEPHNKTHPPEGFKEDFLSGFLLENLSKKYGVSVPTINRWAKDLDLSRKTRSNSDRVFQSSEEVVLEYLNTCYSMSKVFSFYEYGKFKGVKYCNKLKRLFNKDRKYEHLKDFLFEAASDRCLKYDFLQKMAQ